MSAWSMRGGLTILARRMPSAVVTQRIMPWLTFVLALAAAVWTIVQYADSVAIRRTDNTLAIHREYVVSMADLREKLYPRTNAELTLEIYRIRCVAYRDAIAEGTLAASADLPHCDSLTLEDRAALDRIAVGASDALRAHILNRSRVAAEIDADAARDIIAYLNSLFICIQRDQCDREIAQALFLPPLERFLNATCGIARQDAQFESDFRTLMDFTNGFRPGGTVGWSTDPNRKSVATCDLDDVPGTP